GRLWSYSGKGTLVLTRDQLSFTDARTGAPISIPLTAIRDVSLGNYPWLSKPAALHYLSVTWEENGLQRCHYFTPNRGWFQPVWETNPVVIDWHQALRAAVTAATGKGPAETPAPPHRPTAGELVGVGLTFGLPLCLIAAAFIHLRQVADNPEPWWQSGWLLASIAIGFVPLLLVCFLTRRPSQANGQPGGEPAKRVTPAVLLMLLLLNGMITSMILIAARLLTDFFANPAMAGRSNIDPVFITKLANLLAEHPGIAVFAAVVVSVVVDFLIIGSGWSAASRPAADSGVSIPPAPPAAAAAEPQTTAAGAPPFPSACASEYVSSWGFRITPGPAIKTGYVRFWESLFGSVDSPGAINALNLSRIGFIGILAPLAILPGWRWCWPAFGFLGMFGMISAAYLSEATARSGVDLSKTDGAEDAKARRADWRRRIVWLIVGGGILPMTFFALALFVALGRGGEKAMEAATLEQMVTVFAKVLGVGLGLALMIWALLRVVWPKPAHAANPWPRHPEALVALSLLWPLLLITAPFAIWQFVGTSAERLHWETLRAEPSRSALMNSTEWILWCVVLVLVVGAAMEITRNMRRTMRAMDDPSASPEPEPPTQSRWQGWDVWVIGLSLAAFGALWLLRLTNEQLLHRPIYVGAGAGSNVVLPVALATTILLAGAAFLWMLAKNIKAPAATRTESWKRKLGRSIVPAIAVALLLRTFVIQTFWSVTDATAPEIPSGSLVLVWKPTRTFAAGELIAYVENGRVNLGRIDKPSREAVFVKRNDSEPTSVLHSAIVGKVMSVLWRASGPSGVTQFDIVPVGVSNNVVIVDVTTEVKRGKTELRAVLDGPLLAAKAETALANAFSPPFTGTLVQPIQDRSKQPSRSLSPGRQTWRLGFVLPNAALAKKAFDDIRPIGPLPAVTGRTTVGTLFEVSDSKEQEFHAALHVALPITPADPDWVSVSSAPSTPNASALSSYHESGGVIMNWQVLASQPGIVSLHQSSGQSTASLKRDPKTKLYQTTVRLELTQAGADRVLLVSQIGNVTAREERAGNLRELSAKLWSYKNQSATTVRGTEIELCRFQGKPISVLVPVLAIADTSAAPNSVTVSGQSKSSESSVALSWEVSASQSGLAQFSRAGSPIMVLKHEPKGNRYGVSAALELTRLDAERVLFVRRIGEHSLREEIAGNFRELADELLRTGSFSANAKSGTAIELCQFQGKPFTVQVHGQTSTVTTLAPVKVAAWSFPIVAVGITGLCLIGGIVLIVVLWRKGGTAGKVVALLCTVPLLLLVVVLVGYLSMQTGSAKVAEPEATIAAAKQQGIARAAVTLLLLGTDGKPIPRTALVFVEAGGTVSKTKTQGQIASGVTDDMGFVHALGAPPDRPWEIVVLRDGEEIMRSAPINTPVSANSPIGAPNYLLELQATAAAKLDAQLTPLSSEANQATRSAPSDEVMAYRLAMATTLQKLHNLPATSEEKGAVWLPVPGAAVPVTKRMEVAAQTERLRRLIRASGDGAAKAPPKAAALIRPEVQQPDTLATMQSDLAALLLTHGQQHPKVVELRARIAALSGAETQASPGAKAVAAVTLIRREVKEKTPDGRDVAMTFEELRRDAKTSVATVKSVGGGSVGSAMFVVRGAYDIAKARGAAYFINLKEWNAEDGKRMYLIGFAPDKNVDPKTYFDLKEPLPEDKRLLFLSVAAYDRIFKDQP
ncbi:MAG: hypothetical protein B9S33_22285, partial [Pedosphaera sp. Tous-C6FEB]